MYPEVAHAHLIGGDGMLSGFFHPFSGVDHLLAMVAVGIISIQIGGKAMWKIPATFIIFMIVGGILSINGFTMSVIELGIALSVLSFGLFIFFSKRISVNLIMLGVALFAIFHGQAHGAEMPLMASPMFYALGFVASTTLLHVIGIFVGYYAQKTKLRLELLHCTGVGISAIGLFFLIHG
jgi:urease accessory protein